MGNRLNQLRAARKSSGEMSKAMQQKLSEGMLAMFDSVIAERGEYYTRNPDQRPASGSASLIATAYANRNALIAGGASLVPGPWGMLTVLPEIALIVRNQIAMIHDIAYAHGKEVHLSKELLAGVFLTGLGGSAGALLTMQGGKVVVRRAALRAFQRIVTLLAGKVTQQVLRSALSKYVPLLGAAAMATWSRYMTKRVARTAEEVFSGEIELAEEVVEAEAIEAEAEIPGEMAAPEASFAESITEAEYLRVLINMLAVDGFSSPEEEAFVQEILERSALSDAERQALPEGVARAGSLLVDYETIASSPAAAVGLIVDLITLAQRDGTFHAAEKSYIYKTAQLVGIREAEVNELMP